MYYTIYKITNNINGKIYIGAHQTEDLDDGYMGSGYLIRYAIKKYGINSFSKEVLFLVDSKQEMFDKEREIVNEDFVSNKTTYNLKLGGEGGAHTKYDDPEYRKNHSNRMLTWWKNNSHLLENHKDRLLKGIPNAVQVRKEMMDTNPEFCETIKHNAKVARLLTLTDKAKAKRKETFNEICHQQGEKNSQFGSYWIYNSETLENKKIKKDDQIPEGWDNGRKMIKIRKYE